MIRNMERFGYETESSSNFCFELNFSYLRVVHFYKL